jgi:hypothetical protein
VVELKYIDGSPEVLGVSACRDCSSQLGKSLAFIRVGQMMLDHYPGVKGRICYAFALLGYKPGDLFVPHLVKGEDDLVCPLRGVRVKLTEPGQTCAFIPGHEQSLTDAEAQYIAVRIFLKPSFTLLGQSLTLILLAAIVKVAPVGCLVESCIQSFLQTKKHVRRG